MDQPIIECDIFDYVTVNGRISKKLCEKVFVSRIRELESKLKAQQELIHIMKEALEFYANEMNWSLDDYYGISGQMRSRVIMYKDSDERNDCYQYAGSRARLALAKLEAR
jgi:hypothetical protein